MTVNLCVYRKKTDETESNLQTEYETIIVEALKEIHALLRSHGAELITIEPKMTFYDVEN